MGETEISLKDNKPRRIRLEDAEHFERDGFSGDHYIKAGEGLGFSVINVDVHGSHPRKRMVGATRTYLVTDGTGNFTLDSQTFDVAKGDFFIIPDGAEYEYQGQMHLIEYNVPGTTSANAIAIEPKQ